MNAHLRLVRLLILILLLLLLSAFYRQLPDRKAKPPDLILL